MRNEVKEKKGGVCVCVGGIEERRGVGKEGGVHCVRVEQSEEGREAGRGGPRRGNGGWVRCVVGSRRGLTGT